METRVAVMRIIVENSQAAETANTLDAPQNTIAALAGKIGCLSRVSVRTAYSGIISKDE